MLNKAMSIAVKAHEGQVDKAGEPYILHPLRVMLSMKTENEKIVAILHDVVEDSPFLNLSSLRQEGFSEEVIEALSYLTRNYTSSYSDYINRIKLNKLATKVKIADLQDNSNLSRLKKITDKDRRRFDKYQKAIITLTTIEEIDNN
jgi:(p)ppGpp synthase/HD superfamily hydrolase